MSGARRLRGRRRGWPGSPVSAAGGAVLKQNANCLPVIDSMELGTRPPSDVAPGAKRRENLAVEGTTNIADCGGSGPLRPEKLLKMGGV